MVADQPEIVAMRFWVLRYDFGEIGDHTEIYVARLEAAGSTIRQQVGAGCSESCCNGRINCTPPSCPLNQCASENSAVTSPQAAPLTLVLTLEALATSPLGPYGCSWNETPTLDRLAAAGTVWDRWTTPIEQGAALFQSWISPIAEISASLPPEAKASLITDDALLDSDVIGRPFESVTRLSLERPLRPAAHLDETNFGKLVAAASERWDDSTSLLWIHSASLRDVWDAPIEPTLLDEGEDSETDAVSESDQEPSDEPVDTFSLPDSVDVPRVKLGPDDHPDLLFAWTERYAAQVRAIDAVIAALKSILKGRDVAWIIASTSGFSLGQNGWIGHHAGPLRSADLRLPLISSTCGPLRVPSLLSASCFPQVLSSVINRVPFASPEQWSREDTEFSPRIETQSDRASFAVTTPRWFQVVDQELDDPALFLKPDDLDDVNNVARLRRDICTRLAESDSV